MKAENPTASEAIPASPGVLRRGAAFAGPLLKLGARRMLRRKSPFAMSLSLTNRCNFRCTYCEIPLQQRDEMDTASWIDAIDQLRAGGMARASIMGGEPLVRKDLGAIARHLKLRGVHASMNTNGWWVADRIDEVAALDLVCVTLDGPEHVHDTQRQRGSYVRVLRAIEALRARGVAVVTMTVVTPAGIDHVEHVLEIARAHGIRAYFQLEHEKHMDVRLQAIAPELSQARVAELARHLLKLKRTGQPVGNSVPSLERQESERFLLTCDECWGGTYFGYVFSDGTVSHCLFTHEQAERAGGRTRGYVAAFNDLAPPVGRGCSCMPTYEVNHILVFDVRVIFSALEATLQAPH
jgi:MoaA/NifB/PqqE/SkfB family radical SAM enzyme